MSISSLRSIELRATMVQKNSVTRNLVVVRSGRESFHPRWLDGAKPAFDLLVAAYEDTPAVPCSPGIRQFSLPGRKMQGYYRLFTKSPKLLQKYDQIALFDDDSTATQ